MNALKSRKFGLRICRIGDNQLIRIEISSASFFFSFFFLEDRCTLHRLDYYNEHILLHIESLTTTRPGVWLPTSCTLCAHERSPENDEPPKRYSIGNRYILLLCMEIIWALENIVITHILLLLRVLVLETCFNNQTDISFLFLCI